LNFAVTLLDDFQQTTANGQLKVSKVITNEKLLQLLMQPINCTAVLPFSNIILEHLDVSIQSLHEFQNFVTVEIRRAQPFMNSLFPSVVTVELAALKVLFHLPKRMVCCEL
jgi:hypothetical protein